MDAVTIVARKMVSREHSTGISSPSPSPSPSPRPSLDSQTGRRPVAAAHRQATSEQSGAGAGTSSITLPGVLCATGAVHAQLQSWNDLTSRALSK